MQVVKTFFFEFLALAFNSQRSTTHISYLLTWRRSTLRPGCTMYLFVRMLISRTTRPNFTEFYLHVIYDHSPV